MHALGTRRGDPDATAAVRMAAGRPCAAARGALRVAAGCGASRDRHAARACAAAEPGAPVRAASDACGAGRQVALARQIEKSAKEFADWRRCREREMATLRRDGVRQQAQVPPPARRRGLARGHIFRVMVRVGLRNADSIPCARQARVQSGKGCPMSLGRWSRCCQVVGLRLWPQAQGGAADRRGAARRCTGWRWCRPSRRPCCGARRRRPTPRAGASRRASSRGFGVAAGPGLWPCVMGRPPLRRLRRARPAQRGGHGAEAAA
jgi:hypothetical protein